MPPWIHIGARVLGTPQAIADAVESLAYRGYREMQRGGIPPLYGGTIRYRRERRGDEAWKTAREVADDGYGDCEDLGAYRLAELWARGDGNARADVKVVSPTLIHIRVRHGDGTLEDPSALLGMRGKG